MTPQKYLSKVRYQIQYQYQIKLEMSTSRSTEFVFSVFSLICVLKVVRACR